MNAVFIQHATNARSSATAEIARVGGRYAFQGHSRSVGHCC